MIMKALYALVIGGILMSAAAIYQNEYRIRDAEREMAHLREQIAEEQAVRELLKAEWAHLTNPQRIEGLVGFHLPGLKPFRPDQMTTRDGILARLPKTQATTPIEDPIGEMLKVLQ